jgi:hypothetical protein
MRVVGVILKPEGWLLSVPDDEGEDIKPSTLPKNLVKYHLNWLIVGVTDDKDSLTSTLEGLQNFNQLLADLEKIVSRVSLDLWEEKPKIIYWMYHCLSIVMIVLLPRVLHIKLNLLVCLIKLALPLSVHSINTNTMVK